MAVFLTQAEIFDQYNALERTVACAQKHADSFRAFVRESGAKRLICVGCGSSYMLARAVADAANLQGSLPAFAFPAGDLWINAEKVRGLIDQSVVLVLSRSGETSEVVRALGALGEVATFSVACIVCAEGTTLEGLSGFTLRLPWAFDKSVCQTRCVTNLYAAGLLLVAAAAGDEALFDAFLAAAKAGNAFLSANAPAIKAVADLPWKSAVVLADGEISGLAEEGALAFNEICQLPSNYYHILDVRHGPMVLVGKETLVIAMLTHADDARERNLLADVLEKGATLIVCAPEGFAMTGAAHTATVPAHLPHAARGLLYIAVCQMLSYDKSGVTGANPDAPDGLSAWIKL